MIVIKQATDADLRQVIFKHQRVLVKFVDKDCGICKKLAPSFERFSSDPAYKNVLFLRMDAKENPVSSKEVKLTGTPFFAAYKNGKLADCGLIESEAGVGEMLKKLVT